MRIFIKEGKSPMENVVQGMVKIVKKKTNGVFSGNYGNSEKFVEITCPVCQKPFVASLRKKPGKLGKNNYRVPDHNCDDYKYQGSEFVVTF